MRYQARDFQGAFAALSEVMARHRDELGELDAQNGDGDLGVSMSAGYAAVTQALGESEEDDDLGRLLLSCGKVFNEASPSSLGTITSFGLMGMAKELRGKDCVDLPELAAAMRAGLALIMERAGSKPGEKTILDALCPGVEVLAAEADAIRAAGADRAAGTDEVAVEVARLAWRRAARAAAEGSESTRAMRSVHGRAAYYGDKSIGMLDGGSVVGKLIFETLAERAAQRS